MILEGNKKYDVIVSKHSDGQHVGALPKDCSDAIRLVCVVGEVVRVRIDENNIASIEARRQEGGYWFTWSISVQVEQDPHREPVYIPTTGKTVTRDSDQIDLLTSPSRQ